jgi:hypothetical protein
VDADQVYHLAIWSASADSGDFKYFAFDRCNVLQKDSASLGMSVVVLGDGTLLVNCWADYGGLPFSKGSWRITPDGFILNSRWLPPPMATYCEELNMCNDNNQDIPQASSFIPGAARTRADGLVLVSDQSNKKSVGIFNIDGVFLVSLGSAASSVIKDIDVQPAPDASKSYFTALSTVVTAGKEVNGADPSFGWCLRSGVRALRVLLCLCRILVRCDRDSQGL